MNYSWDVILEIADICIENKRLDLQIETIHITIEINGTLLQKKKKNIYTLLTYRM